MSRRGVYATAAVILFLGAALAVTAFRDRDAAGTSPSVAPPPTPTAAVASPTALVAGGSPTPSQVVLSDRFGFVVRNRDARVRSETSDAVVSSFAPHERSFTFLSRVVSPDGRFVAYWDPAESGPVLHVRSVTGGADRTVLTGRAEISGNAFTWSSDSGGLVAAMDNGCFEGCSGTLLAELWTVDLASGATEEVATGSVWLPVAWDRTAKVIAAGVTGPGGYLTGYDVVDLTHQPYAVRSTPFLPTVPGRLKASADAHYVLLSAAVEGGASSLTWWPVAEPEKRSTVELDGMSAEWRPGTSEIWWVGGRQPTGCVEGLCVSTQLTSFDVATGARIVRQGRFGSLLESFRVDGSAAIIAASGSVRTELTLIEVATGRTAAVSINGFLEGAAQLR